MKNLFIVPFFILLAKIGLSQIAWVGNQTFTEEVNKIVPTKQGQFILTNINDFGNTGFVVFDENGNIVMNETLQGGFPSYYFMSDIIVLNDSSIIFSVHSSDCHGQGTWVNRYDKDWQLINIDEFGMVGPAVAISNGSFIMCSKDWKEIGKWSSEFIQDWYYMADDEISDIIKLSGNELLVSTSGGLLRIDTFGNTISLAQNLLYERLENLPNGNFLAQAGNSLYVHAPDLTLIGTYQIPVSMIKDLAISETEISVLTSQSSVYRFDLNLSFINSIQLAGQNQNFNALAVQDTGFLVGGSVRFGTMEHGNYSAFLSSYSKDGATTALEADAGVVSILPINSIDVQYGPFNEFFLTLHGIKAEVKNYGQTPINKLSLNFEFALFQDYYDCNWQQAFTQSFENLNLQPGATTILNFGTQNVSSNSNLSGALEFCMWTSLPNSHFESNNNNDVGCSTILVDSNEPSPMYFYCTYYQGSDELHLETKAIVSDAKVNIYNVAGQLIHSENFSGNHQIINLNDLLDGLYYVHFISEDQIGVNKFVKY